MKHIASNEPTHWWICSGKNPILDRVDYTGNGIPSNVVAIKDPSLGPIAHSIYLPNSIVLGNISTIWQNEPKEKPTLDLPSKSEPVPLYLDYRIIRDPRSYTHLTVIRRHKMNKHKRLKWRKKMLAFLKKKFLKRNIKTEKVFRAELLAQIKEAENFDAEKYVRTILETIDNTPKSETPLQKFERIKELMRKNRKETNLIAPKFDD